MTKGGRWSLFAAKVAVSVSLIAYLLHDIGFGETADRVRSIPLATAIGVLLLMLLYSVLAAARWAVVMRALRCDPPRWMATRITFISAFFNQFLPTSVGADVVRVWESHASGMKLGKIIHSVLLDRATYLVMVSLMAVAGAFTWGAGRLPPAAQNALLLVFVAGLVGTALLAMVDRVPQRLIPDKLRDVLRGLADDTRSLLLQPAYAAAVAALSVVCMVILSLSVLVLANGLNVEVGAGAVFALIPAVLLVSSIPISVAGWGVREYAMVAAFGYAGVPASDCLAISISLAVIAVVSAIPGGVLWLLRRKRQAR